MEPITQLNRQLGGEILNPSALHNMPWPQTDPATIHQPTRQWQPQDYQAVVQAATSTKLHPERVAKATAEMDPVARILWILGHDAFNFNGVTRVRNEGLWKTRIAASVATAEPIRIAYPLFCMIANPAKQMTRPGPHAGEMATIHFFQHVDRMVRAVYPPGLRVEILSDATLYNLALQNTPPTAIDYIEQCRRMVREAGAEESVTVHDYAALLAPHAREFDGLYNAFYRRLPWDPDLISAEDRERLLRSVRASINTERLGLSYADQFALFGPQPDAAHPLAAEIDRMALAALRDQLAIKLACVEMNLPARLWPNHVRASCHKGLKAGVAVVGLRPYPQYYKRCRLLPYHGKPLLERDGEMVVRPEIVLRANPALERIVNEAGESLLYRA
jgi:hypothetical protein